VRLRNFVHLQSRGWIPRRDSTHGQRDARVALDREPQKTRRREKPLGRDRVFRVMGMSLRIGEAILKNKEDAAVIYEVLD